MASVYTDPSFPANHQSIGRIAKFGRVYEGPAIDTVVEWRRLKDIASFAKTKSGKADIKLFEDGVTASDIHQGSLGNCWLLSSLACLATRRNGVEQLFSSPNYREDGKYTVRLWDRSNKEFAYIVIDDRIPVWKDTGRTCFAKPDGNEAWVLLLEKALAKFRGGYSGIVGGSATVGLEMLTGHYSCTFFLEQQYGENKTAGPDNSNWRWIRGELSGAGGNSTIRPSDPSSFYTHEQLFRAMATHLNKANLVAAGTQSKQGPLKAGERADATEVAGLFRSHAYSVCDAEEVSTKGGKKLRMIKIRNPHGMGGKEWSGTWSDTCRLWKEHPEVAAALGHHPPDSPSACAAMASDGFFWMEMADFITHFDHISFCCADGFDVVGDVEQVKGFKDPAFPADHTSLEGHVRMVGGKAVKGEELDGVVTWCRARELTAPALFKHGVCEYRLYGDKGPAPDDAQGTCEAMSALAALAAKPGGVKAALLTAMYRPDGCFRARLTDPAAGSAQEVEFDDRLPTVDGRTIAGGVVSPSGAAWPLLLEKAMAKLARSYDRVEDAMAAWALACVTGEKLVRLDYEKADKKWKQRAVIFEGRSTSGCKLIGPGPMDAPVAEGALFQAIAAGGLPAACPALWYASKEVAPSTGLTAFKSYALLGAKTVKLSSGPELRLVQLADPSRRGPWRGDWGMGSRRWTERPEVARQLGLSEAEAAAMAAAKGPGGGGGWAALLASGSFWMPWEEALAQGMCIYVAGPGALDKCLASAPAAPQTAPAPASSPQQQPAATPPRAPAPTPAPAAAKPKVSPSPAAPAAAAAAAAAAGGFTDAAFPPDHRSLADWEYAVGGKAIKGEELNTYIKWLRVGDLWSQQSEFRELQLFGPGGAQAADVAGNFGYMAVLAGLAGKDGALDKIFHRRVLSPTGKYVMNLYDSVTSAPLEVEMDDRLPSHGKPLTPLGATRLTGRGCAWPLLVYKAVARAMLSFYKAECLAPCRAMAMLTGEYTGVLTLDAAKKWKRTTLVYEKDAVKERQLPAGIQSVFTGDQVLKVLASPATRRSCFFVARARAADSVNATGLLKNKSYCVMDVKTVTLPARAGGGGTTQLQLLKLMDPGRKYMWKGEWGVDSAKWAEHKAVSQQLGFERMTSEQLPASDGCFWMPYDSFDDHFAYIYVCGDSLAGNSKAWDV